MVLPGSTPRRHPPPARSVKGLAIFLLAGLLSACAGGNVSAPDPDGPNRLQVLDPGGLLADNGDSVGAALLPVIDAVAIDRDIGGVTITVRPDAGDAIGSYGFGGRTPDGFTVNLYIDPTFPSYAQLISGRLVPLLAHGMHHARWWRGPGYGSTLFEAMISEGLVDRFAVEFGENS